MLKKNVNRFSLDAENSGGYLYTIRKTKSALFSNNRTHDGLAELIDYRGKRVLDIGCGDGFMTSKLIQLGVKQVVGIDPAQGAIDAAKKRGLERADFFVRDLYDLKTTDYGKFDIVRLCGVLHHLPDPAKACQVLSNLGEYIVGMEPNGLNPVLKIIEKTSRYHIEHEEQSFSPGKIVTWFDKANAELVELRFINLVPLFCPDFLATILKKVEPFVEKIPLIRRLCCGQILFCFKGAPTT